MKFKILLYILGKKLMKKAKTRADFKKKISEKNCTIQIKTADNKIGRYYTFSNGAVTSTGGIAPNPTAAMVWIDAATAFKVLASGDDTKGMQAFQDGSLKLEGDPETAFWFTEVAKQLK
ncbi:MAG: SCP2 sterol-binding domain-containing protein [Deltaproteobacteria bacterium]|nr:SCP2 sterol-binding domain-containing protein [Deltaproteobacteria bacterium]